MLAIPKSQMKQWIDCEQEMLQIDTLPNKSINKLYIPGSVVIPFKTKPGFGSGLYHREITG